METAWKASAAELKPGTADDAVVRTILATRPKIILDDEMENLNATASRPWTWHDDAYPAHLKENL